QHYKQLYDSIKITHAKHIEQVTKLTAENVTLKTSVSKAKVQPPALTRTKHAINVEPIVPRLRNNREELEAEVAQCAVERKHEAIDLKNLLIANDNLIAECLSKEVFSVATKSELNVARFTEMHVANTFVEARCLTLEATLCDKSHQENQGELIKHFSKLEVDHLNLQ
nr:hypothetical protein [Tanacetum cinerariifolium]